MSNQYSFDRKRMGIGLCFPLIANFALLVDAVKSEEYGNACILLLCVLVLLAAIIVLMKIIKNPPSKRKRIENITKELEDYE